MRLDIMNRWLGVKTPAEAFKNCLRCKSSDLFEFEGEVFCNKCNWDSVLIHAEALALAQLRMQHNRARQNRGEVVVITLPSAHVRLLLQPEPPTPPSSPSPVSPCPEVA
jgi:hypothetical protein